MKQNGIQVRDSGIHCEAILEFRDSLRSKMGFRFGVQGDSGIHLRSKFGIQVGIQGFTAKQIWDSGRDSGIHCEATLGFRDSGYGIQGFR